MLEYWLLGLGLMLVIEGMTPFMLPALWRETLRRVSLLQDGQVRFIGLSMMLLGVLVIYLVN